LPTRRSSDCDQSLESCTREGETAMKVNAWHQCSKELRV
jgi:hypothetical protein